MFWRLRKRFTYANVAMTLALVFAMSGGAYAAKHYLITSTKQISPKVLKALQGKQGPAGANGAVGPAGPVGPQGAKGETGTAGKDGQPGATGSTGPKGATGAAGVTGKDGVTGSQGATGPEGVCSIASCVLPKGTSETGEYAVYAKIAGLTETEKYAISFPIRLAESPAPTIVRLKEAPKAPCKGSVEKPEAEPPAAGGKPNLCVFEGETEFLFQGGLSILSTASPGSGLKPGIVGAILLFDATATGEDSAEGTWVVTA